MFCLSSIFHLGSEREKKKKIGSKDQHLHLYTPKVLELIGYANRIKLCGFSEKQKDIVPKNTINRNVRNENNGTCHVSLKSIKKIKINLTTLEKTHQKMRAFIFCFSISYFLFFSVMRSKRKYLYLNTQDKQDVF